MKSRLFWLTLALTLPTNALAGDPIAPLLPRKKSVFQNFGFATLNHNSGNVSTPYAPSLGMGGDPHHTGPVAAGFTRGIGFEAHKETDDTMIDFRMNSNIFGSGYPQSGGSYRDMSDARLEVQMIGAKKQNSDFQFVKGATAFETNPNVLRWINLYAGVQTQSEGANSSHKMQLQVQPASLIFDRSRANNPAQNFSGVMATAKLVDQINLGHNVQLLAQGEYGRSYAMLPVGGNTLKTGELSIYNVEGGLRYAVTKIGKKGREWNSPLYLSARYAYNGQTLYTKNDVGLTQTTKAGYSGVNFGIGMMIR